MASSARAQKIIESIEQDVKEMKEVIDKLTDDANRTEGDKNSSKEKAEDKAFGARS